MSNATSVVVGIPIYKCRINEKSPWVYSTRKKCRYCIITSGEEKATAVRLMLQSNQ